MGKNLYKTIMAVAVIALAVGGIIIWQKLDTISQLMQKGPADAVADEPAATDTRLGAVITYIDGAVEFRNAGGDWKRAEADTTLSEGDSIEIVGSGRAIINLDDGSAVRLNSNSGVTLVSLDPKNILISNDKGQIYNRVVKADREFTIQAGDISYRSLGTAYKTVNSETENGVEVYESKVKVTLADKKEITVDEGKSYYEKLTAKPNDEKKLKDISQDQISKDEFIKWNKEKDLANDEYKAAMGILAEQEPAAEPETNDEQQNSSATEASGIKLSAAVVTGGIKFTWTVTNVNVDSGFKLVKSLETNPVYPGNDYQYLTDKATRSYVWKITDGKTYYFRVCQYLGGKCGVYSNNVKITAPKSAETSGTTGAVTAIALTAGANGAVSWKTTGYSDQGFKVVWSKNSGPTYPCRSGDQYQYFTDPAKSSATLTPFSGSGTYYVRVCEYLGGKCGKYSNEVTITLTDKDDTSAGTGVTSLTLKSTGYNSVAWLVNGYSEQGYKVVWSKNSNPTYPCREGDQYLYYSDPNIKSASLSPFDGAGTYYVRVCEYLGGSCGVYSNQISVSLTE